MRMYIKHIEAKTKKKVDAVFIDRMEFINDKQLNKESENDYVTRKSKGLANMAKDFNVSVVCLIQLNRESVKRKTKTKAVPRPSLVDLRGSGSTEQDAKMVLFVHRECMITGVEDKDGELIIAKNMCGLLGNVNLVFEKYIPKFYICQKEEVSSVPESSYDYSFANDVYSGEADCSFDDDEEREPPPERGYGYSNN
jgi:replicative DNA helicase